ncbi:MAG TPA: hypothetical protein VL689_04090 [Paraburkholderia sp.]|jgi:hypothetical protein|nr:hypothetical protein [Paraburkholderia sp.]
MQQRILNKFIAARTGFFCKKLKNEAFACDAPRLSTVIHRKRGKIWGQTFDNRAKPLIAGRFRSPPEGAPRSRRRMRRVPPGADALSRV